MADGGAVSCVFSCVHISRVFFSGVCIVLCAFFPLPILAAFGTLFVVLCSVFRRFPRPDR